jgi:hypothetical protein
MRTSKFAQYAAEKSNRMFVGTLVKFAKGEWSMGSDRDLISPNQRFVAVMDTVTIGHIKWVGGKPVDNKTGLLVDGYRPLHRSELDDFDSKFWEVDGDGVRKDPWQETSLIVLAAPTAPHDLFTFSTSTEGGQGAIGVLCEAHDRATEGVGQYPVVTLDAGSYKHKIKSRGNIDFPIFKVVDAIEAGPFNALVAGAPHGAVFIPTSPPALATPGAPIAITSGWVPPTPPEPTAPPLEHDGGPDDGFYSDTPF